MERPQYANAFSISLNPQINEIVLSFTQEYPDLKPPEELPGAGVPMKLEAGTKRETVGSFVLPAAIARQLAEGIAYTLDANKAEH